MIGIVKLQQVIQSIINGHNGSLQNYMIKDLAYIDEIPVNWCPRIKSCSC